MNNITGGIKNKMDKDTLIYLLVAAIFTLIGAVIQIFINQRVNTKRDLMKEKRNCYVELMSSRQALANYINTDMYRKTFMYNLNKIPALFYKSDDVMKQYDEFLRKHRLMEEFLITELNEQLYDLICEICKDIKISAPDYDTFINVLF